MSDCTNCGEYCGHSAEDTTDAIRAEIREIAKMMAESYQAGFADGIATATREQSRSACFCGRLPDVYGGGVQIGGMKHTASRCDACDTHGQWFDEDDSYPEGADEGENDVWGDCTNCGEYCGHVHSKDKFAGVIEEYNRKVMSELADLFDGMATDIRMDENGGQTILRWQERLRRFGVEMRTR